MFDCPECRRTFETAHGRNVHYGHSHGTVPRELKDENEDPPTTPTFTDEHRQAISESQQGENNNMYGKTQEQHPRYTGYTDRLRTIDASRAKVARKNIAERRCEGCTVHENDHDWMDVHHINGDPNDNRLSNLRYLCRKCHRREHTGGK